MGCDHANRAFGRVWSSEEPWFKRWYWFLLLWDAIGRKR